MLFRSHQSDFAPKTLAPISPASISRAPASDNQINEPFVSDTVSLGTQSRPETGSSAKKARILLAEDNEINALLGCRLLEHMGYDVTHVTDGQLALTAIKNADSEGQFDVVLMDIHMPHMDGIRATQEIRAYEEYCGLYQNPVPIIALTANAFDDVKTECYSVGMNAYLAKPFAREELREIIENCLRTRIEMAG